MSQLAVLGGTPVRTRPFVSQQTIGAEEKAAVLEVLDSGVLSKFLGEADPDFYGGPQVQRTEQDYARTFSVPFAVTTNSASTGLHAAVAACGVGPGDEVIVSPFTMSASATAILMQNAVPVFADIHPDTFCLDPASVRRAITPRTRAIMMVDLYGQPAHWDEWRAIAREHGLRLIEDAAQAAGAQSHGRPAGTLGDVGVLSLNYHKIIHSGEGGVVLTRDADIAERLRLIRNHGEVVVDETTLPSIANTFGLNYRMTEIEAAIARVQLGRLPGLFSHRERLARELTKRLDGTPFLGLPKLEPGVTSAYYVFAIKLDPACGVSRARFAAAVNAEGISLGEGYVRPIYLQPMYQQRLAYTRGCPWSCGHYQGTVSYDRGICPTAERMHDSELMLGVWCHPPQTESDVADVAAAFQKVVEGLPQLRDEERRNPVAAADSGGRAGSWRR